MLRSIFSESVKARKSVLPIIFPNSLSKDRLFSFSVNSFASKKGLPETSLALESFHTAVSILRDALYKSWGST